ncbi:MAG: phosphoribosylanthranilate isomerase [bacterium]
MTRIKICGITNLQDAHMAVDLGADALGFVFADSPRKVSPETAREIIAALPPFVDKVGVFVNEDRDTVREIHKFCRLTTLQFHGDEDPDYVESFSIPVIKVFGVDGDRVLDQIRACRQPYFLLDAHVDGHAGGTGQTFDWEIARQASSLGQVILSGGLNPDNVVSSLEIVRPYAVDVSSGIESRPGVKDPTKMKQFIQEVRTWDNRVK